LAKITAIRVGYSECYTRSSKGIHTGVYTGMAAQRSNNFIVGLTNISPLDLTPTLWNYTLCGQYPGAVPASATVSLYCPYNLPPFRYVIIQFPINDQMNFCELEVFAPGT